MHLHFIPKTIDHATILVPQLLTKIPNMYWKVTHIPFSIWGGQCGCRTVFFFFCFVFGIAFTTLIPNKIWDALSYLCCRAKENAKKEYCMAEAVGEHSIKNRPDSVMEIAALAHEHV